MQRLLRGTVPMIVAASLLTACGGGGGTATVPSTPNSTNGLPMSTTSLPTAATAASSTTGDFQVTGAFTARGDADGNIHFFPVNDGLWIHQDGASYRISAGTRGAAGGNNLLYNGGPIQNSPKTYVVYWGRSWNSTGDPDGVRAYYNSFLTAVGGSAWNSTVTQYYQTNPSLNAGNPANNFGGSYIDTTTTVPLHPSQSQLAAEARKAEAHFGDSSVNAQYIVFTPHGKVPSGFKTQYCAYHDITSVGGSSISWTLMPYIPDAGTGCGSGSVTGSKLDGVSIVGGHEMAESETDPQLNAWLDSSGSEIGDKCAWVNLQDTNLNGTSFPTQPLWSNKVSGCVQ